MNYGANRWAAAENDAEPRAAAAAEPEAVLDVDEQLRPIAAGPQLDDRVLHRSLRAVTIGHELDRRLRDVSRLDLDDAGWRTDDEMDGALHWEGLPSHRRHPRLPLGLRTRMDGSCLGGLRSPMSCT